MLPDNDNNYTQLTKSTQKTKTHKMDINNQNISSYIDDKEALEQAIFKTLSTERNKYLLYSRDYGVELEDLFGQPISFVISQIEERIKDALSTDDRILNVYNFDFEKKGNKLITSFNVSSIYGEIYNSITTIV